MAPRGETTRREVFSAERIVIRGDLDISNWLKESIRVRELDLYGLQVDAWPVSSDKWSLESLVPQPRPDSSPPRINLHDAIFRLHSQATTESPVLALHDINGKIECVGAPNTTLPFGTLAATHPNNPTPFAIHLTGRSGGLLRNLEIDAKYDPQSQSGYATGLIENLHFSQDLVSQLPLQLSQHLSQLSGLDCHASSSFEISSQPNQPPKFQLQGKIDSGRLQDPRLPYPLENIRSDFFVRNSLLQLRSFNAKSGRAQFKLNTDIEGFGLESPMVIHAEAQNLELDNRLYQSLPDKWQAVWDRLKLAGMLSGGIELQFDGTNWRPSATVMCQNVSITPWLFPFPLNSLNGQVNLSGATISSKQLTGTAGGETISGSFNLTRLGTEWYGGLRCRSEGAIAINEQLISALTPVDAETSGAESFVRSLAPSGAIELISASITRPFPNAQSLDSSTELSNAIESKWYKQIEANIYDGTVKYDKFQYPIYNIRGRLLADGDRWTIDQFEGRNDSGRILCSGGWTNVDEGLVPFQLRFEAFTLPLEEELQTALPSDAQFIWDELRPSGSVDSVTATIYRDSPTSDVVTQVELVEESSSNHVTGRSLRLHPKSFPYWLTDVDCRITYRPGFVAIERVSAINGTTRLALTGECNPVDDGRWRANVRWLPTTRLIVDSQFLKALPESVRKSLLKLDFSGPVSVFGTSQILFTNAEHDRLESSWDCQLDIEDGQLADGKNIGAMRGTVWMKGYSDGVNVNATGSLGMDALTVLEIPVTNLRGPFAMMGSKLYFGSRVNEALPAADASQAQQLTADALAGKLTISGMGRLDSGKFYLDAELRDAELSTLLQDVGVNRASIQALCHANLEFNGIPWNPQTYDGQGTIQLRDAKLYQLPFMMRLMRTASVNTDDDSAFQTADISFEIDGDRIPLQVACDGDVLRLRGEGWTNLRREIDLELYSYVGRRIPISRVVAPLLSESRYATFMMIEVDGTLDNPIMQRRPFPQLEATLQQIFPDVEEVR